MHRAISPRFPDKARNIASNRCRAVYPRTFLRDCSRSDSSSESLEYTELLP